MANTINLTTKFLPILDDVYKVESRTSMLEAPAALVQTTADSNTFKIAKLDMDGAASYDRANGFVDGSVSLTWESHTFSYDRGRSFQVDAMDDQEAMGLVAMNVMSEYLRTKLVPELDAVRFAKYANNAGLVGTAALTSSNIVAALNTAIAQMGENEVTQDDIVGFITPTQLSNLETALNRTLPNAEGNVDGRVRSYNGIPLVQVPQSRFYMTVTLLDGKTSGQEAGGYTTGGSAINFLLVSRRAVMQITKHAKIREFSPDTNQEKDAWKLQHRLYGDAFVLANKVKGIYLHKAA